MGDSHTESMEVEGAEITVEVEDESRRRGPTDEDRAKGRIVSAERHAARVTLAEELFSRTPDLDPRAVNDAIRARLGHGLGCANLYRIKRRIRASLGLDPRAPSLRRQLAMTPTAIRSRAWRAAKRAQREGRLVSGPPIAPPPPAFWRASAPPVAADLPPGIRAAADLILSEARDAGWYGTITVDRSGTEPASIAWSHTIRRVESGRVTVPGATR